MRAGQQLVHRQIGGQEGEAVGQLESALVQAAAAAHAGDTQGRLVDQLQGKAGLYPLGGLARPAAQQVPGSQAEQLGSEQPQADGIVAHLVGQELTDAALKAAGIAGHHSRARLGHPGGQRLRLAGTIPIEFFFEGRLVR